VTRQARNLLANLKGQTGGLKFSIRDQDAKFTAALDTVFTAIGIRIESPLRAGLSRLSPRRYVDAVRVRPREAADLAAAQAFLARHNSLRVARLGELVHPLDHPALVAEAAGGQLLGVLTYVPGQDWRQCEILTLHVGEQWRGAGPR
jgi:hypothetical protein